MRHGRLQTAWDSINAKRGFPFSSNPTVWAYTWKIIETD